MSIIGLRAASFVVLLGVDRRGRLFENRGLVDGTTERMLTLLRTATDQDEFIETLRSYGPRARGRYRDLLEALANVGSGIQMVRRSPSRSTDSASLTASQVNEAIRVLLNVQPDFSTLDLNRVSLTALNLTRRSFELFDNAAARRYSGRVSEDALALADGLRVSTHEFYRATLTVQTDFAVTGDAEPDSYVLESITPMDA